MGRESYDRAQHTRRQLIKRFGAAAGVFIATPLLVREAIAQVAFSDDPFRLGIASVEASGDGFVIWTRLAPKQRIRQTKRSRHLRSRLERSRPTGHGPISR